MAFNMADLLTPATVPAYKCPQGTKMHLLNLGTLQCDEGWLTRGGGTSTLSNKKPETKRRDLVVLAVLIEHPDAGLILFETGCAENIEILWGAPLTDVFPRTEYEEGMKLPNAIKATGNDIKDVKAVIFGHLHLDHAGGLEHFLDSGVPVYVHEEEFKHGAWAVATKADHGVYLPHYFDLERLNWKTFTDAHFEIYQGITLHHSPGHTPGLCVMQINLPKDGTFIATTDQYHVRDMYEHDVPHGWLARDHTAWVRSHEMIKQLQRMFKATMIFGHDKEVFEQLTSAKKVYE